MFVFLNKMVKVILKIIVTVIIISIVIGLVISTVFPIAYKDFINKYSQEFDVDPFLVAAIINVESKYNKTAISSKDARGLMQIGKTTGDWGATSIGIKDYTQDKLFEPEINIRVGTWYIKQLSKEFNGELQLILAAYNAGSGNVNKWLKDDDYSNNGKELISIPFKETDEYIEKVYFNYKIYKFLYEGYMENPDSINTLYTFVIINIREYIKSIVDSLHRGGYVEI